MRYTVELINTVYLLDLERFDVEEDILICITLGKPVQSVKYVLRDALDDIKIADVRFLNSMERGGGDSRQIAEFDLD